MSARNESNSDVGAIVGKFGSSENMQHSPVSFLIPKTVGLLEGTMSPDAFCRETIWATNKAQFYFRRMPVKEQNDSLRVFNKEFRLSDEINECIMEYRKTEEDWRSTEHFFNVILSLVKKYISTTSETVIKEME